MAHLIILIGLIGYIVFRSSTPYQYIFVVIMIVGLVMAFTGNRKKKGSDKVEHHDK